MRKFLVSRLRFLGFSLWALALTLGGRLAALPAEAATPEPRFGQAPASAIDALASEAERLAGLQAQLAAAEEEIANLRKALELLGPLPDHPGLFIPVTREELAQRSTTSSTHLFHHAELGAATQLAATPVSLVDTLPGYDDITRAIRLAPEFVSGDFGHATVDALSVELSALAGPVRAVIPVRAW
jgi:hypothetical protein